MLRTLFTIIALIAIAAAAAVSTASSARLHPSQYLPTLNVTMLSPKFLETVDIKVNWDAPATVSDDWVSVWHVDINATYLRYANVTQAGAGSATFTLLNTRRPYYIRYMRGAKTLAKSQLITPELDVPMEIRLSAMADEYGGADPTTVRVSWTIAHSAFSRRTGLLLGKSPTHLSEVHLADAQKTTTYTHSELNQRIRYPHVPIRATMFDDIEKRSAGARCGYGCYRDPTACTLYTDPGTFVNVDLTGLEPDSVYYYSVGTIGGRMSSVKRFRTRPLASGAEARLLYIGDGGLGGQGEFEPDLWTGPSNFGGSVSGSIYQNDLNRNFANFVWKTLTDHINAMSEDELPHMQVWVGDASYTRGWSSQPWSMFHWQTRDITSVAAMAVLQGNHEFDHAANNLDLARGGDSGGEAGLVYGRRMSQSVDKTWWFRRVGPIAYVGLNSEAEAGPQVDFLRTLETNSDFLSAPWKVVSWHRPPMHSVDAGYQQYLREHYGEFTSNHFDLVVYGHDHFYRRSKSLLDFSVLNPCKTASGKSCRPVFHNYRHLAVKGSAAAACFLGAAKAFTPNATDCKARCARDADCTGVQWQPTLRECQLLKCDAADYDKNCEYNGAYDLFSLTRKPGQPPVFVLNGNSGAEYSFPEDGGVDYRADFTKVESSGWGTIKANATHLTWRQWEAVVGRSQHFPPPHLEARNKMIDELVLTKEE